MQSSLRPPGPLSLVRSDIIIFDEYVPGEGKSKKYLDRLLGFLRGKEVSTYNFIKTVKAVIERWSEQLEATFANEVLELQKMFDDPPRVILRDDVKRSAYFHLFAKCAAYRIDRGVEAFHVIIGNMTDKAFKIPGDHVRIALEGQDKIMRQAMSCYALLNGETQAKMRDCLILLQNQPDVTFADALGERFKIFQIAAECFSYLDVNMVQPPLQLPERKMDAVVAPDANVQGGEWRDLVARTADMVKGALQQQAEGSFGMSGGSPKKDNSCEPGLNEWLLMDGENDFCELLGSSPIELNATLPQFTPLSSDTEICALLDFAPSTKHLAEIKSKLQQFRQIHNFGSAFLRQYGEIVIADVALAVIMTIKNVKNKQRLIQLVLSVFKSMSSQVTYQLLEPFLLRVLDKHLPDMITATSQQMAQYLKHPDLGEEFCHIVMKGCMPLCFSETTLTPLEKKSFLLQKLQALSLFFSDLNQSLAAIAQGKMEMAIDVEEQLLIGEMNRRLTERGMAVLIPKHKNHHTIEENLFMAIEALLKAKLKGGQAAPEQLLMLFLLASSLSHMLNRIFSPNGLCILIDLCFESSLKAGTHATPKATPSKSHLDPHYTEALQQQISQVAIEMFKLVGGTSQFEPIIQKLILEVAPLGKIAKQMHKFIHEIVTVKEMNDVLVMPIFLLNQLLYGGEPLSTCSTEAHTKKLLDYLTMDASRFQALRQKIDVQIEHKPVEYFRAFIDQHLSCMTKFLIQSTSETLCQNLATRLYRLSKQEMIVKMAISYLLFDPPSKNQPR